MNGFIIFNNIYFEGVIAENKQLEIEHFFNRYKKIPFAFKIWLLFLYNFVSQKLLRAGCEKLFQTEESSHTSLVCSRVYLSVL